MPPSLMAKAQAWRNLMFPVGDDRIEGGPAPLITVGLIALNVVAFLYELGQPSEGALQSFIQAWGVVPREYTVARDLAPTIPLPFWSTLLTSMFLHGGWMHLGGNMLYLWIFGDNLEKVMGHARFLFFYLVCGVAAGLAHIFFSGASNVPTVGASGAISGVLGGYLLLFPRNRIRVLTRGGIVALPAIAVLGFWIVIQLVSGMGSIAVTSDTGGVAYMAHVGGFVAGLLLVKVMVAGRGRPMMA
jgi:rhomboid family protein